MAQNVEEILKLQLGHLMLELAVKESQLQALREENETLKSQQSEDK